MGIFWLKALRVGLPSAALELGLTEAGLDPPIASATTILFFLSAVFFSMWCLRRSAPPLPDEPFVIRAWKVADLSSKLFKPLGPNSFHYAAEDSARCAYWKAKPGVPHGTKAHNCGFYAYLSRRRAMYTQFLCLFYTPALLEVEMLGRVIEGSRRVVRAEYQRVLSVQVSPLCHFCRRPCPRRASCMQMSGSLQYRPSCTACARYNVHTLEDLQTTFGTEIRWQDSRWLRLYFRLLPERL